MNSGFNDAQRRAVEAGEEPVLIVAGPGTGKTRTLAARIAYLLQNGTSPQEILALTFTKKAAEELTTRLATMLQNAQSVKVFTFHSLCHEILGAGADFATESQRLIIIKHLSKPTAFKHLSTRELGLVISRAKNTTISEPAVQSLVVDYNAALTAHDLRDFDDLLLQTKELLQDAAKRRDVQARYRHILVDEFQDTNALQYELLQLIRANDNLFVIGDPNQSIYGFRGASGDIFERFGTDFPAHTRITLTQNYRSALPIVALSNAIYGGDLSAEVRVKGAVRAVEVLNEYSEANWVLAKIQQAIGGSDLTLAHSGAQASAHLRDFAIVYRSRSAAAAMQKAIDASGLPYQVVGDGSPYEQPEVRAMIGHLRLVDNDTPPHMRAEQIMAGTDTKITPALKQFVATLVRFPTTKQALEYIDELATQNFYDPRAEAITLLTIHAAKGLEFTNVFLIGAEEGVLPNEHGDVTEERRLFYVAVTRAKQNLDVLHARFRRGKPAKTSRFITDLSTGMLPRVTDPELASDQRRAAKRRAKRAQATLF